MNIQESIKNNDLQYVESVEVRDLLRLAYSEGQLSRILQCAGILHIKLPQEPQSLRASLRHHLRWLKGQIRSLFSHRRGIQL